MWGTEREGWRGWGDTEREVWCDGATGEAASPSASVLCCVCEWDTGYYSTMGEARRGESRGGCVWRQNAFRANLTIMWRLTAKVKTAYFNKTIPTQDPLTRFYLSFKQCHMVFKSSGPVLSTENVCTVSGPWVWIVKSELLWYILHFREYNNLNAKIYEPNIECPANNIV